MPPRDRTASLCLALTAAVASAAAGGPTPGDVAAGLITAGRAGDVAAVRRAYTPAAWARIAPVLPSARHPLAGVDDAAALRDLATAIDRADLADQAITGDTATVTLVLHHRAYDERVRLGLTHTADGWQVDDRRPPFWFDPWPTMFAVWSLAYDQAGRAATADAAYADVVAGVNYATAAVADRPDDLALNYTLAQLYLDRLATGDPARRLADRARGDTLPHPAAADRLPPLLTATGTLLPALTAADPVHARPPHTPPGVEPLDGTPLQYLRPYQTFPYGVDPAALAYNAARRAQVLHQTTGQVHPELSTGIMENRPFMALRQWATDEQRVARTADVAGDRQRATFGYARSARLADDALAEHVLQPRPGDPADGRHRYAYAVNEVHVLRVADDADLAFLAWRTAPTADRAATAADRLHHLIDVQRWYGVAYSVPAPTPARLPHVSGMLDAADQWPACDMAAVAACYAAADATARGNPKAHPDADDWADYDREIARAADRLRQLGR